MPPPALMWAPPPSPPPIHTHTHTRKKIQWKQLKKMVSKIRQRHGIGFFPACDSNNTGRRRSDTWRLQFLSLEQGRPEIKARFASAIHYLQASHIFSHPTWSYSIKGMQLSISRWWLFCDQTIILHDSCFCLTTSGTDCIHHYNMSKCICSVGVTLGVSRRPQKPCTLELQTCRLRLQTANCTIIR